MEHTRILLEKAHEGDKQARDTLAEENMGLVWSIARRFQNRGVELEDLFQIGSIGLLKAIDKFDCSYDVKFSTYAVPMIMGEIKRFLRDEGVLKVSRSLKEIAVRVYDTRENLEKKWQREPTMEEIAKETGISMEDLLMAMEASAQIESLSQVIYQGDGNDISLMDKLEEKESSSEKTVDRLFLEEILGKLTREDRELILQRYFQDKTQSAIAKEMGVSQVQISRREKKILKEIREKL